MKKIQVSSADVNAGVSDERVQAAQREPFECRMHDGSIFRMPNPTWDRAYWNKYGSEDQESIKRLFCSEVVKHWKNRTVPTKFDYDESWESGFDNQAALGEKVMYQYIRAALMGLVLAEMSGGKSHVIGIGDKGKLTEYGVKAKPLSEKELFSKHERKTKKARLRRRLQRQ
jgi:hypothetical protein